MRLGLFGCRANNAGLGSQTWELWRHLKPEATLVVDYSEIDGKVSFPERFKGPNVEFFKGPPTDQFIDEWLDRWQLDAVMVVETPYNYYLYKTCQTRGITTFNQYNFEFLRNMHNHNQPLPDVLIAPTIWCVDRVQAKLGSKVWIRWMPVPVAMDRFDELRLTRQKLEKVKTFVHVAGYKVHRDRNGTEVLLQAIRMIKADLKFIIYSQHEIQAPVDDRVEIKELNLQNYWDLYKHGDCLILPRRFGGLSLPQQEGAAAGMIVIMPECNPNWYGCHPRCMFPTSGVDESGLYPINLLSPELLALEIERVASFSRDEIHHVQDWQLSRIVPWTPDGIDMYTEMLESHSVVCSMSHSVGHSMGHSVGHSVGRD